MDGVFQCFNRVVDIFLDGGKELEGAEIRKIAFRGFGVQSGKSAGAIQLHR